jgi:hypothetical protein
MSRFTCAVAALSPWRFAWWGVSIALLGVSQMMLWLERSSFRTAMQNRPEPSRGREAKRVKRLATSGIVIPPEQVAEVRALVDWSLRAWTRYRRVGFHLSAAAIVWWGGLPATFAVLRGKWGAAAALFAFPALVLAADVPMAWQLARMRRTAAVNGWLVNGQVADAR